MRIRILQFVPILVPSPFGGGLAWGRSQSEQIHQPPISGDVLKLPYLVCIARLPDGESSPFAVLKIDLC